MKLVLAPDKFKNSLTGLEFCNAVEEGLKVVLPKVEVLKLPLADGGDGTIEVVNYYLKGKLIDVEVSNPFFETIKASYLFAEASKTAFIEMAEASGVKLLKPEQFDCKNATTLGTGQLISHAINLGAKQIILGIGGSATNDCGIGMTSALGYKFLDKNHKEVKPIGANLSSIKEIDLTNVKPELKGVTFKIACDVSNPLYGAHGAAHVYAKQKGANTQDILMLDKGLQDFSKVIEASFGINPQRVKGAGAAGGMGIAGKLFLNGQLKAGIELVKDLANFNSKIENADWIITGEGKLDDQTLSGKTIQGVLMSAQEKQVNVAAFCGAIEMDETEVKNFGINYADAIINYSKDLDDAMKNSYRYLKEIAKQFAERNLI